MDIVSKNGGVERARVGRMDGSLTRGLLDRVHGAIGDGRGRDRVIAERAREPGRSVRADPDLNLVQVARRAVECDAPLARLVELKGVGQVG